MERLTLPVLTADPASADASEGPAPLQVITYGLRGTTGDTTEFHAALAHLTDMTLARLREDASELLARHCASIQLRGAEVLRTDEEYLFEMLMLGVLWRSCGARAVALPRSAAHLLTVCARLRRRMPRLKPRLDPLRARMAARLFNPSRMRTDAPVLPSRRDVAALLRWLEATGEYREESARLQLFEATLAGLTPGEFSLAMLTLRDAAARFEFESSSALGAWTQNVDAFVSRARAAYQGREDYVLACRPRVEYHLAMLGADVMNRVFRAGFRAAARRMVLVPACMRGPHAAGCRSRREGLDHLCTGCTPDCNINRLRVTGGERNFEVRIIPHSSDFSAWLRTSVAGTGTAVVGVACILNLLGGGYELRTLGIPAQCVFLDAAGCAAHWHPTGITTDIDHDRLAALLR